MGRVGLFLFETVLLLETSTEVVYTGERLSTREILSARNPRLKIFLADSQNSIDPCIRDSFKNLCSFSGSLRRVNGLGKSVRCWTGKRYNEQGSIPWVRGRGRSSGRDVCSWRRGGRLDRQTATTQGVERLMGFRRAGEVLCGFFGCVPDRTRVRRTRGSGS